MPEEIDPDFKNSVLLAHPGTQHSLQTALALCESGLLLKFVTSIYHKPSFATDLVLKCAPSAKRNKIIGSLNRRRISGLNEALISTFPFWEIARIIFGRLPLPTKIKAALIPWRNKRFDRCVAKLIRTYQPKAVICYDTCAINSFAAAKEVGAICILDQSIGHLTKGAKLLLDEQTSHPDFADGIPEHQLWLIEMSRQEALIADAIFVSSDYAKESLTAIGVVPEKIYKIEYGADVTCFKPAVEKNPSKFRFLFVGAITQRKGIKYLLEAFKKINLPCAELVLIGDIVGSGNGLLPYKNLFTHIPKVSHAAISKYFAAADVFVFPSLHESGVIAIHEALASGLPIITTPNAGSVVRDGIEGFIVPIRDIEALAYKMLLLYSDHNLRTQMSKNAVARAKGFTWERYRKRVAETVLNLLNDNSQSSASQ